MMKWYAQKCQYDISHQDENCCRYNGKACEKKWWLALAIFRKSWHHM